MKTQNDYILGNKKYWDEVTPLHEKSAFYDVESFKKGKLTILPLEIEEIGPVAGKSFLHLQCHFGMDTMSWTRLGAKATGVDLSDKSIKTAKKLAGELNLDTRFICSDIYKLPEILHEKFNIVYTTGGVLCWLPDLTKWAKVIGHFLKPKGTFYLRDDHPFAVILNDDLKVENNYFHIEKPLIGHPSGSYAEAKAKLTKETYEWNHSISDIINSLINAGLTIEFFHEFPHLGWARFPKLMKKDSDGRYRFKNKKINIPLMFSLKARQ